MLKHVQISPLRNRADSVSLRSSTSCTSSMYGSPEPPIDLQRSPSRASSYSSLNEHLPQTTIKVFTNCLKIDIEYKTLGIQWDTTSKEVISQLLRRLKMRHRDPRLFYLSMEVSVRRAGIKTILVLDNDTRPAILQACHPKGESRFCLQLKPGGLIRVHTSALQPSSQYKSLIISEETTSDELLQLLLSCYNSVEPVEQFSIYEVCPGQEYQRKLHPDDIPLRAQTDRMKRGETCHFLVRRNPCYTRRCKLLSSLTDVVQTYNPNVSNSKFYNTKSTISSLADAASLLDMSVESISDDLRSLMTSYEDEDCGFSTSSSSDTSSENSIVTRHTTSTLTVVPTKKSPVCSKCRNNFKSCEFCHKSITRTLRKTPNIVSDPSHCKTLHVQLPTYNPVYNIREIRTASHSFSSLGSDKKLLDIHSNARFDPTVTMPAAIASGVATSPTASRNRPHSVYIGRATRMVMDSNLNETRQLTNSTDANGNVLNSGIVGEAVNNNPARGLGHFVYL